jgi:hypothetical protein
MRRRGRRSPRRTARGECRHLRRRVCRDYSRSRPARCRRHVGCRWRSHNPRSYSDAHLPFAAQRSQLMSRPRWLAQSVAVRLAARSLLTILVSTHRTAGRPYLVSPTAIADDAQFRYGNPTQARIMLSDLAVSENLHPNARESARAQLAVSRRCRRRSLSEFRAPRAASDARLSPVSSWPPIAQAGPRRCLSPYIGSASCYDEHSILTTGLAASRSHDVVVPDHRDSSPASSE